MKSLEVSIPVDAMHINGTLNLIPNSTALVIFAHGSGSSRFSKRNQFVADILQKSNISTFLFDLITTQEEEADEQTGKYRFDIELLSKRLILATDWAAQNKETKHLKKGYFGASTGAAAALIAAAQLPDHICAVVSRGGRPDLALEYLKFVKAPTLLIVGALDKDVIDLNTFAYEHLKCEKDMQIIKGASHLFEEKDTLEQAGLAARSWFLQHMMRF